MKRNDFLLIAILVAVVLILFYPLFYTEYLYTDESVQLWKYRKGLDFSMFISQGRYITEKLFYILFSSIDTIKDIRYLRLFSLFGWIACLPVWYGIIKKTVTNEKLPAAFGFLTVLYLITCPPFSISVYWASCMELFIANTCGLVSGYILFAGIRYDGERIVVPAGTILLSIVFGVVSLFTYQNGFGCFFIPFFIHLLARKQVSKSCVIAVGAYLLILLIYYLLFKYNLQIIHIAASERTSLHIDPWGKLGFFFYQPLASAFHFTWLFNEQSVTGLWLYRILFGAWVVFTFFRRLHSRIPQRILFMATVLMMLALIYLPSLIVTENYSSNRTLLALDIAIFILFFEMLFYLLKNKNRQFIFAGILSMALVINAGYNFNRQFLFPVKSEYLVVRSYIEENYNPNIKAVYFIRSSEDAFRRKYKVTSSWDEFGVPSTFFEWVPEFFVKQVVFEKTHNRNVAELLTVKNWKDKQAFLQSGSVLKDSVLLVDAEQLIAGSR